MRVVSTRVVYENRWMRVHEDRLEGGGLYGWVEKSPSALIVPIEDDDVWLIEQYRHPVGQRFWEFPQGAWEGVDGAPEELARGELREETGLRAGVMEHLGRLHFAYGLSDQAVDVLAGHGTRTRRPASELEDDRARTCVVGRVSGRPSVDGG